MEQFTVLTISQSKVISYIRRPCKTGSHPLFTFNVKAGIFNNYSMSASLI